jgi:hypothetical protein
LINKGKHEKDAKLLKMTGWLEEEVKGQKAKPKNLQDF